MSINDEWEEMHLTPGGWTAGSYRHTPWPAVDVPRPDPIVLTVRRHISGVYGGTSRVVEERTPLTSDMSQIEALLVKYGSPTFAI
ncbi:translation initiation factor 1 [Cupriavidus plantarum]|uniref:translation initiation factor 1 n=1 Tax=Cupriavidus plantarum TaxID=942865 RepID=UPI000EACBF94|nr:translation initiation factor 1 [Cupriavidus plantarum]RLK33813.1 hypothetical protein C7417_4463 [Cupriavidus plantarum]